MTKYVVVDLNRSIGNKCRIYWKENKRGYTPDLAHAGIYTQKEAIKICQNDIEAETLMLPINNDMERYIREVKESIELYSNE